MPNPSSPRLTPADPATGTRHDTAEPSRRDWLRRSTQGAVLALGSVTVAGCAVAQASGPGKQESTTGNKIAVPVGNRMIEARVRLAQNGPARGLVIAIHGGGYTGKYFDAHGSSAMEQISEAGYNVVALDRPGFGRNADWLLGFDEQVPVLIEASRQFAARYAPAGTLPFLYGHSIGGMMALLMANAKPELFSGISMTGSGYVYQDRALAGLRDRVANSPGQTHAMSGEAARIAGFMGPKEGFDPQVARLDPERDVPSLMADLRSVLQWPERLPVEAARATVPVHFVMPQFDGSWRSDTPSIATVQGHFRNAPFADIYVQRFAGHSIELQYLGRSHVFRMLAFAEECRLAQQKRITPRKA